jgi:rhamnogalacturonyl hydrolase YesR
MEAMGEKFDWQLRSEHPDAGDQSVGQTYLELYLQEHKPAMKAPTQATLDRLVNGLGAVIPMNQAQVPWWWCDALFMAPPVWCRMFAATDDAKYLAYIDEHWWETSKLLYDPERHLYFRDITFLPTTDGRGNPIFWSRGNGGGDGRHRAHPRVYASQVSSTGEVRSSITRDGGSGRCPARSKDRSMACEPPQRGAVPVAGEIGLRAALAGGINHGVLDRSTYTPVIERAWAGLVQQIYADGRLGSIQQTGAAPAHYLQSSSYTYGVGAFLPCGRRSR